MPAVGFKVRKGADSLEIDMVAMEIRWQAKIQGGPCKCQRSQGPYVLKFRGEITGLWKDIDRMHVAILLTTLKT